MTLYPPPGSAVAELDPVGDAISATDGEVWRCWDRLHRRILASLTPDWIVSRTGTHHGYDILARSRLHVIGIGVRDDGLAELMVDLRSGLDAPLRDRILSSAQYTGALIFERLSRFQEVRVLSGHVPLECEPELA